MINFYPLFYITGIFLTIASCTNPSSNNPPFEVKYKGELKNIMHKGDISAKANLSDFKKTENLYALGAIEQLKGEIQIFNGKPFNTMVVDGKIIFDTAFSKKATLFVYASVKKWKTINIPDSVMTIEQFESYLGLLVKESQLNINEPFPFMIKGMIKSFDWHIINWKEGDMEHTHDNHKTSGLNGTINDRQVVMLGFYSNSHHAIFTHHTTNMHIHVKTMDGKLAGHIDNFILGKGMTLELPKLN